MAINFRLYSLLIILVGCGIWVTANFYGLGLTHDSHYYIDQSNSNVSFLRPQLFLSYCLSFFNSFEEMAGKYINGVCYLLSLIIWSYLISRNRIFSSPVKLIFLSLISLSLPLILVSSFLWTEPLYILVSSVCFLAYYQWKNTKNLGWIVLLSLSLLLAIWIRKVGLIFLASFVIVFIQSFLTTNRKKKFFLFLSIGLLFLIWNFLYSGETPKGTFFLSNLMFNTGAMINWFVPVSSPVILRVLIGIIVLGVMVCPVKKEDKIAGWIKVYFLLYFFIRLFVEREFSEEADRYFSILYIPSIYYFLIVIVHFVESYPKFSRVIVIVLTLLVFTNSIRTFRQVLVWNKVRYSQSIYLDKNYDR